MEHLSVTLKRIKFALEMARAMDMEGADICVQLPFHEVQKLFELIQKDRDQKDMGF